MSKIGIMYKWMYVQVIAKVHYSKPHLAMFEHMRVPSENNVSSTCLFYLIFIYELNSNQLKVYTQTACLFIIIQIFFV